MVLPVCGRSLEPCVPCCCGWLVQCDPRVHWRVSGTRKTVLTIDDFPSSEMDRRDFEDLLDVLRSGNGGLGVHATFFVIWSRVKENKDLYFPQLERLLRDGHELGVHYAGRWGWSRDVDSYIEECGEFQHYCLTNKYPSLRFVRPPGGFATQSFVAAHFDSESLITVIGTAYPFDADLCECMPSSWIGRCAASLSVGGGRIVILHVGKTLVEKLRSFLSHAKGRDVDSLTNAFDDAEGIDQTAAMLPARLHGA